LALHVVVLLSEAGLLHGSLNFAILSRTRMAPIKLKSLIVVEPLSLQIEDLRGLVCLCKVSGFDI
jgi:hypothetical protein